VPEWAVRAVSKEGTEKMKGPIDLPLAQALLLLAPDLNTRLLNQYSCNQH